VTVTNQKFTRNDTTTPTAPFLEEKKNQVPANLVATETQQQHIFAFIKFIKYEMIIGV